MKTKNTITIEDVEILNGTVTVDYFTNDNPLIISKICLDELKQFVLNRSLNDFIFDSMQGEHIQEVGSFDVDTFIEENKKEVVRKYLIAYPLVSVSRQLDAMVLSLVA